LKIYEWAKLIERCRTAQQDYFRAVRQRKPRSMTNDLLLAVKQQEYRLDSAIFDAIPTLGSLESDLQELIDLAGRMRDAQKDWVKLRDERVRLAAIDLERRLDRLARGIIERHETTPSLFDSAIGVSQ
jgi:hypothetical protein